VDIPDGDLVRLARDGDAAAFRLLVERHQPMARARAARLCSDPADVDDVVQESFLRAFVALGRLQDPDRFAGWLGGIVLNVYRAMQREARLTLLGDWPEPIHPVSAHGLPSADDLDLAEALRGAVAGLPPGQRRAVELYYYADMPVDRIADSPGAAKASLHKARRRLREYITAHRPDLIPAAARRTPMITVRIAHAEPWPGRIDDHHFGLNQVLVVLADDAGGRAMPLWLRGPDGRSIWWLLDRSEVDPEMTGVPEELTTRLLQSAGVTVSAVDIDELGPEITAARIETTGPAGTHQVTARVADGLALAVTSGAPVRVADAILDRLAVPVTGGKLLEPFLPRNRATPVPRPQREPRNMTFADGMEGWVLGGNYLRHVNRSHWWDYSSSVEGRAAVLESAVPEPYGFAALLQQIIPDDYSGCTLVFRGEVRTEDVADQAGLFVRFGEQDPARVREGPARVTLGDPENHLAAVTGSTGWTWREVTVEIPVDARDLIRFGVYLAGRGRVGLRNAELVRGA
jgi:RNA polymerase sigma-70 factor, ECF subfamily